MYSYYCYYFQDTGFYEVQRMQVSFWRMQTKELIFLFFYLAHWTATFCITTPSPLSIQKEEYQTYKMGMRNAKWL